MGADFHAKGLADDKCYHGGYITLCNFKLALAKKFNKEGGELLEYFWIQKRGCDKEIAERLNTMFTEGQRMILFSNDCDDKWIPKESKLAYLAIKDIELNFWHKNYHSDKQQNLLELFKGMFYYSWKRRVNLYVL